MREVVIVEAARTPVGRFRGGLKTVRADHLGAAVLGALVQRAGITPEQVDDVVFGCVSQVGEQCANIARTALLSAGWPESIPGMTVDRKCGSAEAAVHVAVGSIAAGLADAVVAGGAESMTRVPMGGNRDVHGMPFGWRVNERFALTSQGESAERLCDLWSLDRDALDDYALESHARAARAADAGYFDRELVPLALADWCERGEPVVDIVLRADETIRRDTSRERLATLKTSFRPEGGRVTAGNASQISDGAAALLLMSAERARSLGVKPRARIVAAATVGSDPVLMLTGPIAATRKVLERAGLTLNDIDLFEINEAFAPVPMVWMREFGVGHERLNVNGGAIALGHPLGASGARIIVTLLYALKARGLKKGIATLCIGGGEGTALAIELI